LLPLNLAINFGLNLQAPPNVVNRYMPLASRSERSDLRECLVRFDELSLGSSLRLLGQPIQCLPLTERKKINNIAER